MKVAMTCPNCGKKKVVSMLNPILAIVLSVTIIFGIIYLPILFKKIKCPNCGTTMQDVVKIHTQEFTVDNSNNETNKTKCKVKCPKCGELVDSDNKFCPKCGAKIKK